MVAETERIPDLPPMEDTPPKRKRRSKAEMEAERGAAPPPPPKKTALERYTRFADIHALLRSANSFAFAFPTTHDDALSDYDRDSGDVPPSEVEQLASALDAYQANTPKVHKWVEKALSASPGVALAIVCVGLVLPRLERHGLLPWLKRPEPERPPNAPSVPQDEAQGPMVHQNGLVPSPYEHQTVGAA